MKMRWQQFAERLAIRSAIIRKRSREWAGKRLLSTRRAGALVLGAALSIGGVNEAFRGVDFLVEKDLDRARVVKQENGRAKVVAELEGGFAANSLYKISRALPDGLVSARKNLFESEWIPGEPVSIAGYAPKIEIDGAPVEQIAEQFAIINDEIRESFFRTKVPYGALIHEKAEKHDVDPTLVAAVMEAESQFRRRARSPVGAAGLMQLMPRTARWMGAKNVYDPQQNVEAGVKYLKYLEKRFDGNRTKILAAYNAGEGNVRRYGGVPPFRETRNYVKKVMKNYEKREAELKEFGEQQALEQALTR